MKYRHRHQDIGINIDIATQIQKLFFAQYISHLELKVISAHFVKYDIFGKGVAYRMETCTFLRKGMAKISRKKFFKILRRTSTLQNPSGKTISKCSTLRKSNMNSAFWKIAGCALQGPNFIKTLVQHRLFSKTSF